ncbi:MAG: hypothetical protein ACRDRG_03100 [Pseudonocardiaceae bacterium]
MVDEDDCLKFKYEFYKENEQGKLTSIKDPGPRYFGAKPHLYDDCDVASIDPPTDDGGSKKVPAGSTIRIRIVCTPHEPDEESSPEPIKTQGEVNSEAPNKGAKTYGDEKDARIRQGQAEG